MYASSTRTQRVVKTQSDFVSWSWYATQLSCECWRASAYRQGGYKQPPRRSFGITASDFAWLWIRATTHPSRNTGGLSNRCLCSRHDIFLEHTIEGVLLCPTALISTSSAIS